MEVLQDTYKDTKIGRIPKDWNTLKINQVADCYGGTTPSTVVEEYWNGDILWATPSDITKNKSEYLLNTSRKITEQGRASKNLRFVKKNGLLMTSRASIGFLNISNGDVVTNQGFINIECKDNFHYKFFYYWVLDNRKKLLSLSQGSTFLELYRKTFAKISIPTPPLPEQQKIADILSTVDEQISTTEKIIEKSKELKKGLMQKLFAEGIGHTEFKDTKIGRIPKDWEFLKIGDFSNVQRGASPRPIKDVRYFSDKGRGWIRIADVSKSYKYLTKTTQYLSELGSSKSRIVNEGDIIMSICGSIGKPIIIGIPSCIHDGFVLFSKFQHKMLPEYLYYFLYFMEKYYIGKGQEGTQKNLNTSIVKSTKLGLPPLPEQQKIAAILSEADAKIEKEQTQKAQLEALKKGLMQQLLTGKKRVKV